MTNEAFDFRTDCERESCALYSDTFEFYTGCEKRCAASFMREEFVDEDIFRVPPVLRIVRDQDEGSQNG